MDSAFEITSESAAGSPVVHVRGEIDIATAPALREQLDTLVDAGRTVVTVDLRGVDFLDSTGLGVLVGGQKRCNAGGGALRLVIDSARIRRLFEITGLTELFEIDDHL